MNVVDIIESLEKINIHEAVIDAVDFTTHELADINRAQLSIGMRSDDELVHWLKDSHYPYIKSYARKRERAGLQTDEVDLNFFGDFYNSIDAKVENDVIEFNGSSPIAKYLEENYSPNIYGINDDNTEIYIEQDFSPRFTQELTKQSGINF